MDERDIIPSLQEPGMPVVQAMPKPKHRKCNGARLHDRTRYDIEEMLLRGESKRRTAKIIGVSQQTVAAVAEDLKGPAYAEVPRGEENTGSVIPPSFPDLLREKAALSLRGITADKITRATPQACAMITDKLLGRAESLEDKRSGLGAIADVFQQMGIQASHSASRLVVRETTKELELTTEQRTQLRHTPH